MHDGQDADFFVVHRISAYGKRWHMRRRITLPTTAPASG